MVDKQQHKRAGEARYNTILGNRKSYWSVQENQYSLVTTDDHVRISRYGIGGKRTLDQFIAFTGIDTRNRLVFENKCGKQNKWVEFVAEPDGDANIDSSDVWGYAAEKLHSVNHKHDFVLHANSIPLVASGSKKRLHVQSSSSSAQTEAQARAQAEAEAQIQVPVVPDIGSVKPVHEMTVLDAIWEGYVGFWFDDWVTFTEQLIATQIAENPHENSVKVTKLLLILFPVLICILVAALYPSLSDSGTGTGTGSPGQETAFSDSRLRKGKKYKQDKDKVDDVDIEGAGGSDEDRYVTPTTRKHHGQGSGRSSGSGSFIRSTGDTGHSGHSAKKLTKLITGSGAGNGAGSGTAKSANSLVTPPRPNKTDTPTSP